MTRAIRTWSSSALLGYVVILVLESGLTLLLLQFPLDTRSAAGLGYLYLPIVILAAVTWTMPHTVVAVLGAVVGREISISSGRPPLWHVIHFLIFTCIVALVALLQYQAVEKSRRLQTMHELSVVVAKSLQLALVPGPTRVPGYDSAFRYEPATEDATVGGDFLDLFEIDKQRIAMLIGDVTGHGVEAAVDAAQIRGIVAACAIQGMTPANCLVVVNDAMYANNRSSRFATLFVGILDLSEHRLIYSTAGHEPPLVCNRKGEICALATGGTMLGVSPSGSACMMDYWIDFLPGDTLLLYTDGVVEARRDREFYGRERLEAGLLSLSQTSAESCVNAIFHSVRHFAANQLRDDVALLLLSRPLGAE